MPGPFEYAPAPESRDIARLKPSYQIFVDGRFRDGRGPAVKTINPADEEPLAEVGEASEADVDDAVRAARRAFEGAGAEQLLGGVGGEGHGRLLIARTEWSPPVNQPGTLR